MLITTKDIGHFIDSIIELENKVYPLDFFVKPDEIKHWLNSNMFFCNAIVHKGRILSVISFLITNYYSIESLLYSKIIESELKPYNYDGYPVLYFSSLILKCFQHGPVLFKNIFSEIREKKIFLDTCYSIAANKSGFSFLEKLGFVPCGKYKEKYPIMVSSEYTVLQSFFKKVLVHNNLLHQTANPLRPSALLHSGW